MYRQRKESRNTVGEGLDSRPPAGIFLTVCGVRNFARSPRMLQELVIVCRRFVSASAMLSLHPCRPGPITFASDTSSRRCLNAEVTISTPAPRLHELRPLRLTLWEETARV